MKRFRHFFNFRDSLLATSWKREAFHVVAKELTLPDLEGIVFFRRGSFSDIDGLLEVERQSYDGEIPWNRRAFEHEMKQNRNALYLVLTFHGKVIGFIGGWFVQREAHITNVAVVPEFRQRGLASFLLEQLIQIAKDNNYHTVSLEVRVSNTVAQEVYRKLGFVAGQVKESYYADDYEDALEMSIPLDEFFSENRDNQWE